MNVDQLGSLTSKKLPLLMGSGSGSKALRARLRATGFTAPVDNPQLWPLLYSDLDDQQAVASVGSDTALMLGLVLFAKHERNQGVQHSFEAPRFGRVLASARKSSKNPDAFDTKFVQLLAAADIYTVARRLNGLFALKSGSITVNLVQLVQDLYRLQGSNRAAVLRSWAELYYAPALSNTSPIN